MTELALVLPVFVVLLLAIVQFGIVFNNYLTLTDATRAGARKAAVSRFIGDNGASAIHAVKTAASGLDQSLTRPDRHLDRRRAARPTGRTPGDVVTVTATYPYSDQHPRLQRPVGEPHLDDQGATGMKNLRSESGQVMVLTALFMVVMVGMTAFVVDVGSWFRAQRATQSTVDAAALAGAQALPADPTTATSPRNRLRREERRRHRRREHHVREHVRTANDTIRVTTTKPAPRVLLVGLRARPRDGGRARVGGHRRPDRGASTSRRSPSTSRTPTCRGRAARKLLRPGRTRRRCRSARPGAPGAFDLINLNQGQTNGTVGESTLADWLQNGYSKYLPLGGYFSDPGAKFNGNAVPERARTHGSAPTSSSRSTTRWSDRARTRATT